MKKWFSNFMKIITDPERELRERLFILLTIIADTALFLAFIGDIIVGEHLSEMLALGLMVIAGPIVSVISIRARQVKIGAALLAFGIVFVVHPIIFFTGGGLKGGALIWYTFSFLYIGLILTGALRTVMLTILTLSVIVELNISYFYPQFIIEHNREMWYVDAGISILLVGFVVFITVLFQNKIFLEENRRAKEQARQIEELNRSQGRFFSSMSHEIRTPINTIIGLNEMILRGDISDDIAENAENIRSASKLLLAVVNDILDMSKIESGRMEIVKASYSVLNMVSEVVSMISPKAKECGLVFNVDLDPRLPSRLICDETRIKQILINLLNNAIKYTKEGSITLSVSSSEIADRKVTITYTVEDTGMGIHKESIPHLFDAFQREDIEKNRYIEGTGLGLSIVKQLVDLMGGEVSVNSVYTKGSTFLVTLEQAVADETPIGKVDISNLDTHGERNIYHRSFEAPEAKVLIVDDNKSNLMVAEKLLRDTRVKIDTVESGRGCLDLTAKKHYHAIFMDHMMPEMDGIECFHAVRNQAGGLNKDTPVIALTANAGGESAALYHREGFDAYIVKPVEPELLEEALLSVLPKDLVFIEESMETGNETAKLIQRDRHKVPLLITTDSVSDLPLEILESKKIPVLPYSVHTDVGVFLDGMEADGDVIFRYLKGDHQKASSEAPSVSDYENFFADQLSGAHNILHITMAKYPSLGFEHAEAAAQAFYNVNVFDSGHLSSGMGLMVMAARALADEGVQDIETIMSVLEKKRSRIRTSFIVDDTEYLCRSGKITEQVHNLCRALMLHPVIEMKNSAMKVGGVILGSGERARAVYIRRALRHASAIDKSVLFITYAGIRREDVEEMKEEALSVVPFEKVYLQKASPAVSTNCGPGTFGLIFSLKE